jgi:predicted Rossmann fold flavoprotein
MNKILVIGGGAGGIFAALAAATNGAEVTIWEKNDRLGKKLAITGKGRCNVTNACPVDEIIKNLTGNGRFLYSAFNSFDNRDTMDFFEKIGVPLKVERGQRVFPVSDKASTVVKALEKELNRLDVKIFLNRKAEKLLVSEEKVIGARCKSGDFQFDKIILATGGCTYKATGSTGDGYQLAKEVGHSVTAVLPSLVPLVSSESWIADLAGLALKNSKIELYNAKGKKLAGEFGEMLFTHFGLSGPCILTISDTAARYWLKHQEEVLTIVIDLKPALSFEQLDARVQRDFEKYSRKIFANSLGDLLPKSLIPIIIKKSGIEPEVHVNQITRDQRLALVSLLKAFPVKVTKTRPLNEGIVTAGGINIKEVNPKTFESKIIEGLYIVGELLDVHGFTGGYNLQAAFSSGYIAGMAASETFY